MEDPSVEKLVRKELPDEEIFPYQVRQKAKNKDDLGLKVIKEKDAYVDDEQPFDCRGDRPSTNHRPSCLVNHGPLGLCPSSPPLSTLVSTGPGNITFRVLGVEETDIGLTHKQASGRLPLFASEFPLC